MNGVKLTTSQMAEAQDRAAQVARESGMAEVNLRGAGVALQGTLGAILGVATGASGCLVVDWYAYSLFGSLEPIGLA